MAENFNDSPYESLGEELCAEISERLVPTTFERGSVVYNQYDEHQGLYWLHSGTMLAHNVNSDGEVQLAFPVYRSLIGAGSIGRGSHGNDLVAATTCQVKFLPPRDVARFMEHVNFIKLVTKWSAEDFDLAVEIGTMLISPSARTKLLGYLQLVVNHAVPLQERKTLTEVSNFHWPFTTQQLAEFLGMSRPYLSTLLSKLADEGVLKMRRGSFDLVFEDPGRQST